jgi:2-phospho-L-lactate/phosphoenolpyruvate guanylyltransferase
MDNHPPGYVVVVPVKPPARAKSRLSGLPGEQRIQLASAFALDTVAAALACDSVTAVLAVTDDFRFAGELSAAGCEVLPDGVSDDLNGTLVQAAREAARRWPGTGVAALCADLPALRSADLEAALSAVPPNGAAFAADTARTGTTMYAARLVADFAPAFGPGSASAHLGCGASALAGELASLRRDVDNLTELNQALALGAGVHTRRAWNAPPCPAPKRS